MKDIFSLLAELKINYVRHDHPALFTCDEAEPYYAKMEGAHSKNIFLRNRNGDTHYLVIVPPEKKLDLKALTGLLAESKIGFASPERLMKHLGLTPGSVTPFGLINDAEKSVKLIIDEELWQAEKFNFHPNTNTATLTVNKEDFKKFLDWCGNEVRVMKL